MVRHGYACVLYDGRVTGRFASDMRIGLVMIRDKVPSHGSKVCYDGVVSRVGRRGSNRKRPSAAYGFLTDPTFSRYRFLLSCVLIALLWAISYSLARADFPAPSTPAGTVSAATVRWWKSSTDNFIDPQSVCDYYKLPGTTATYNQWGGPSNTQPEGWGACQVTPGADIQGINSSWMCGFLPSSASMYTLDQETPTSARCTLGQTQYVCPVNSSVVSGSGSSTICGCVAGFQQNGTGSSATCTTAPPCPASGTPSVSAGGVSAARPNCRNGCSITVQATSCHDATGVCSYTAVYGGMACQAGATNIPAAPSLPAGTPICPTGKCPGTVNGVQSCLACGTSLTPTTTTQYWQKQNPDGSSASGTTTVQQGTGAGWIGWSSTQTTSGGVSTTTTGTGKPPVQSNNDGPGGSADTPGAGGKGQDDYCAENPGVVACMNAGTPSSGPTLPAKDFGGPITPIAVGGAGSCPADIQLPKGAYFTFAGACQVADGVRPVVILVAWFLAAIIVVGAFKD